MMRRSDLRQILGAFGLAAWLATPAWTPDRAAAEGAGTGDAAPEPQDQRWRSRSDEERAEAATAAKRVVGQRIGRTLVKAREYLLEQEYEEAEKVLDKIHPRRANAYERALAARIRAYVAYGKQDYDGSIEHLRQALAEDILSRSDRSDVLFQIAQIQNSQSKWAEAVDTLKTWFAEAPEPGAAAYVQLALAHYRLEELDPALEAAQKAVALTESPQQGWLQLLLAIHLTQEDYAGATPVLIDLLTRYPQIGKAYWLQLSTLYGVQEDIPRALAVLELAHRQGLVVEDRDLRRLAQLSQSEDMPIRTAQIVEQGLESGRIQADAESYELLAHGWILARESEKAEPALARAAELSPEGDLYVRLAQVRMLGEQWESAAQALRSAMAKGGLDDPGRVELLLGITYYNADQLGEARSWFARARRAEKARDSAEAWLEHIDRELQSQRAGTRSVG